MNQLTKLFLLLALLTSAEVASAGVVWNFNNSAQPSLKSLKLLGGSPKFAGSGNVQGLAAGVTLQWEDAPQLQVRPELEIRCRFRLDALPKSAQTLASKDGEYLLRIDGHEGGNLSMFVQLDGSWEPRLRGPVVEADQWYEVHVRWTGDMLSMEVNGQRLVQRHAGKVRPGDAPLSIGPIAGVIDRLEIDNPGFDRQQALLRLPSGNGKSSSRQSFGGKEGWNGWQAIGGAKCTVKDGVAQVTFPSATAMFVSPPLNLALANLPFACLEVADTSPEATGGITFASSAGTGSLTFQPYDNGRPTLISGVASDQWTGTLKRLAVSFRGSSQPVAIQRLVLSDHAVGSPWLYIRDLAAGRAKLRPGREESVIAAVKNLGGEAESTRMRLRVPDGIEVLGDAVQIIPYLGQNDFDMATWRIKANRPGDFELIVDADADGAKTRSQSLRLSFEPLPELQKTGYVPQPLPAKSNYISLMHYCALWKEGTHFGWKRIEPWPGRRPAIGWYDEGTPEVADWHIKYALEHGINGFIYCWYRAHMEPKIEHRLGHAIHDGLFHAKYRDQFKFCIMWENGCAPGVKDADDLLQNVLPFWIENYFTHPSYLKLENKPVLFIWQPRRLIPQLGGPEGTRAAFDAMRQRCREAGFAGLRIIACMDGPEEKLGQQIAESGWDAVTGYGLRPRGVQDVGIDPDGIAYRSHADVLSRYKETWEARDASTGNIPDIPNVVMGWDVRPWGRARRGGYIADPQADNFAAACRDAKAIVDAKPADRWDKKLVVFDNWTEFGEGHYLEPTSSLGFSFLNALKEVFCTSWAPETVTDIIPEDVGLQPPQRRYEEVRAGYGRRMPWQPQRITGDLLARWECEEIVDGRLTDSSPNDSTLVVTDMSLAADRGGKVLRCGEGEATCPAPMPFFHTGGITIAMWCKPSEPNQSDHWLLNTVGKGTDGYRLGLGGGRPIWQVPLSSWSHRLSAPDPLPADQWSHIAASFDNRMLRLYVNGVEVGSLERTGFINPSSNNLVLGGYSVGLARARFQGALDDVRIYRRVLTADEIATLATPR